MTDEDIKQFMEWIDTEKNVISPVQFSWNEVAIIARAYATGKVSEQRKIMSEHLNMRNVPRPKSLFK
jgi:hypothetical protein